jgi:hypothetical protein
VPDQWLAQQPRVVEESHDDLRIVETHVREAKVLVGTTLIIE